MKKIGVIILILAGMFFSAQAQDCSNYMENRKAEPPYQKNSLSKSALVVSGHKYEFVVPLQKGYDYRIMFFASPVFNNRINFKIIDLNTNEVVLDLPGETEARTKGSCALAPWVNKDGKEIHPYFDFYPQTSTSIKIVIDVLEAPSKTDDYGNEYKEILKGCLAVVILDKPSSDGNGF